MTKLAAQLQNVLYNAKHDETGAAAAEYGLLIALIAVVIITAVTLLGTNIAAKFTQVANAI
jgi:pilus assembly protein Flp/PilA